MATDPLILAQDNVEFGGKSGIMNDFSYNNNVMQAAANIRMGKYVYVFCHLHIFSSGKSVRVHKNILKQQVRFNDRRDYNNTYSSYNSAHHSSFKNGWLSLHCFAQVFFGKSMVCSHSNC
jgi:hypothetical protein